MVTFLLLWWVTFGVLFGLRYVAPGAARAGMIAGASLCGALALLCGLMLAGQIYLRENVVSAVILPEKVAAREGPAAATKASFAIHEGLKVRVLDREGRWLRIRLANGLEGWVPRDEVGIL
jgi:hypothetical protein